MLLIPILALAAMAGPDPAPSPELRDALLKHIDGVALGHTWRLSADVEDSVPSRGKARPPRWTSPKGADKDPISGVLLPCYSIGQFETNGHDTWIWLCTWSLGPKNPAAERLADAWGDTPRVQNMPFDPKYKDAFHVAWVSPDLEKKVVLAEQNISAFQRDGTAYVCEAEFVGALLAGLPDITQEARPDGSVAVTSPSYHFSAIVDPIGGRLLRAHFEYPSQENPMDETLEFGGWYPDSGLGMPHPAWARISSSRGVKPLPTIVLRYSKPAKATLPGVHQPVYVPLNGGANLELHLQIPTKTNQSADKTPKPAGGK